MEMNVEEKKILEGFIERLYADIAEQTKKKEELTKDIDKIIADDESQIQDIVRLLGEEPKPIAGEAVAETAEETPSADSDDKPNVL